MDAKQKCHELLELAKKHQGDNPSFNVDMYMLAGDYINHDINNFKDAFACFAGFNYLNFAAKRNNYVSYAFKDAIQYRVKAVIDKRIKGVDFFYTMDGNKPILYVKFFDFVFSYHNVDVGGLKQYLSNRPAIKFDGVRKQPCAELILKAIDDNKVVQKTVSQPILNKGGANISFSYRDYSIDYLIKVFSLKKFIKNDKYVTNIAYIFKKLYFLVDMITTAEPRLPDQIVRPVIHEIYISSYSVLEAVEVEIGAKLLNAKLKKDKYERDLELKCIDALHNRLKLSGQLKDFIVEYRHTRNCVHLTKDQDIAHGTKYTPETVNKHIMFLTDYFALLDKSFI